MLPLASPAARTLLAGLNATELTPLLPGSARSLTGVPLPTGHTKTWPFASPAARYFPSGLYVTERAPWLFGIASTVVLAGGVELLGTTGEPLTVGDVLTTFRFSVGK